MEEIAQRNIVFDFEIITLMTLVLGLAIYALGRKFLNRRLDHSSPFEKIDLVLMLLPAFLFLWVSLYMPFAELPKPQEEPVPKAVDILTILFNLGYFGVAFLLTYAILEWVRDIRIRDIFGLDRLRAPEIIVITLLGGIASLLICGAFLGAISQEFLSGVFSNLEEQAPVKSFRETSSNFSLALKIGTACVAAPLAEEFIFRGYIYGTVKKFTSPVFSAVISSALFAAAHGNLSALFPLWGLAILLVISYESTKCLWVPVGIHAFFNAIMIIGMFVQVPEVGQ